MCVSVREGGGREGEKEREFDPRCLSQYGTTHNCQSRLVTEIHTAHTNTNTHTHTHTHTHTQVIAGIPEEMSGM